MGIIPAGAGHLKSAGPSILTDGDHPRRCGALHGLHALEKQAQGSSPQVRGTSRERRENPGIRGIIPAGAGHLGAGTRKAYFPRDHPRRCGALKKRLGGLFRLDGSSPQVRGTS